MCRVLKIIAENFTVDDVETELKNFPQIIVREMDYWEIDGKLMVELHHINDHCLCEVTEDEMCILYRFIDQLSRCNI